MQVQRPKMLEAGEYTARITDATESQSKAGNDMLVIRLLVDGHESRTYTMTDYIVADNPRLPNLLRAAGMPNDEGAHVNPYALIGKVVRIETFIQPAKGEYGPKAVVKAYSALPTQSSAPTPPPPATEAKKPEEDLPF